MEENADRSPPGFGRIRRQRHRAGFGFPCSSHRAERTYQDRSPPGTGPSIGVGIKERKIELISRDTQSDPTKAVNAVARLTQCAKVSMIFGPLNSGKVLAVSDRVHALARGSIVLEASTGEDDLPNRLERAYFGQDAHAPLAS